MKKTYTKKQITEAISYWKKQLNENIQDSGMSSLLERLNSWSKETGDYIRNLADQLDQVEKQISTGNFDVDELKDNLHLAVLLVQSLMTQFEI